MKLINCMCFETSFFSEVLAGETSFLVCVSSEHRKAAFSACQKIVDDVKALAPIWKKVFESYRFILRFIFSCFQEICSNGTSMWKKV